MRMASCDDEPLFCALCGERNYDKLKVQQIEVGAASPFGIYSFCELCWHGPNLGRRLLQLMGCEDGLLLNEASITTIEISEER